MRFAKKQNSIHHRDPQNYIGEHFNEDISLSDLSSQVYLNPKYISELFKKETGVNFSDYLSAVRIEKG